MRSLAQVKKSLILLGLTLALVPGAVDNAYGAKGIAEIKNKAGNVETLLRADRTAKEGCKAFAAYQRLKGLFMASMTESEFQTQGYKELFKKTATFEQDIQYYCVENEEFKITRPIAHRLAQQIVGALKII